MIRKNMETLVKGLNINFSLKLTLLKIEIIIFIVNIKRWKYIPKLRKVPLFLK